MLAVFDFQPTDSRLTNSHARASWEAISRVIEVPITIPAQSKPIFDFVVQVVFGTIGFLVVFGAATLISVVIKLAEGITPDWVLIAAGYAEKGLFAVDLFCFGLLLLSETLKLTRSVWKEWRRP